MSGENVEIITRLIDGINADEVQRDLITEDFELKNATTAVTDATYHGPEAALKWRRDLFDVVEDAVFRLDEVLAEGNDYVVIANSLVGRGSSSGMAVDLHWASVFWFRDGKIARAQGYNRRRDALAAVGEDAT